jgi:hypothetical protein
MSGIFHNTRNAAFFLQPPPMLEEKKVKALDESGEPGKRRKSRDISLIGPVHLS